MPIFFGISAKCQPETVYYSGWVTGKKKKKKRDRIVLYEFISSLDQVELKKLYVRLLLAKSVD